MTYRFDTPGHGTARDGRCFNPPIPPGATVSWKPLAVPDYIHEEGRVATHVVAVWDSFEQMDLLTDSFQETSRGRCVAFYANRESLEDLMESAVPAPDGVDARIPSELMLARLVYGDYVERQARAADGDDMPLDTQIRWLHTAVWIHRVLTDRWPILGVCLGSPDISDPAQAAKIRQETERLFSVIRSNIEEQKRTCWWTRRAY